MCLAVPAQIQSVDAQSALVSLSGVTKTIDITLTPDVLPGEWVIVHVGFALQVIDEKEAQKTLEAMQSLASQASL